MIHDVRFAFRQLRKNPAFATVAVITLGLGIGAAAAMFGLIQGVLFRRLPTQFPDGYCSYPQYGPTVARKCTRCDLRPVGGLAARAID